MKTIHIFHISESGGHSKAAENLKEALLYKNPQIKVLKINIQTPGIWLQAL